MTAPLLIVENLTKHFPLGGGFFSRKTGAVKAVDGVSFTLNRGETLALVGESGCGKSTTGRLVLRLLDPTGGRVTIDGVEISSLSKRELRTLRRRMQIVFQDPFASLNPRMTIGDILAEPLLLHGMADKQTVDAKVKELLAIVGLAAAYAERFPHEFSGGQRQRIGVARALATQPDLIVCDEPVSALDVSIQAQVVNLLQDLQARFGMSYLFIAHDLAVVRHIADRVAVMYLGRIVEIADKAVLYSAPKHPYTRALLAAAPVPRPGARDQRSLLTGDVPSPVKPPPGCTFHTRCPYATDLCKTESPAARTFPDGATVACHHVETLPPSEALALSTDPPSVAARMAVLAAAKKREPIPA
ncbi:ABC transporter ATP-binding protein [Phreatobacter stygius]|uniref:Dipeptide ABC transporter ATP-binding protein n=1 Tax=Phreatobacter stygius TaxID=1940610 RepID=A0A4D7B940_9HYPH|nr:dipeptide ABC transporter ATP-binding protein [Phreatobacter stygius]QCI66076.1 dipeptide ABC transporter ATP-binding protein [Phreatobacter stygius]